MKLTGTICVLLGMCLAASVARAGIPEPDVIAYGTVRLDGTQVMASDPVTVLAKVSVSGTERLVGSYRMGSNTVAGNNYVLRIRLESLADGSAQANNTALVGQTVRIYAQRDEEPEVQLTIFPIASRGQIRQLNLPPPPTVDAGTDQVTYEGWSVNLHAVAVDPDGDTLTYAWIQTAGKPASLAGSATANALFTAPSVVTAAEASLTFTVTVSDGKAEPAADSVNIRVRMMGDVSQDDSVDVVDLLMFVEAFGSFAGDSNYNLLCDLSPDGSVDVVDLLIFVENFGRAFE